MVSAARERARINARVLGSLNRLGTPAWVFCSWDTRGGWLSDPPRARVALPHGILFDLTAVRGCHRKPTRPEPSSRPVSWSLSPGTDSAQAGQHDKFQPVTSPAGVDCSFDMPFEWQAGDLAPCVAGGRSDILDHGAERPAQGKDPPDRLTRTWLKLHLPSISLV